MLGLGIGRKLDKVFPGAINVLDKGMGYFRGSAPENIAAVEPFQPEIEAIPVDPVDRDSDEAVMSRAVSVLESATALGKAGRFMVVPEFFSISATDNCNLRCTMCPGHSGMTGPRLSLEEAESLFGVMRSNQVDFGRPAYLDMTAGEPMLNTELHLIFRKFKETVPNAEISVISNATFPVKGRVAEAFALSDRVGLSVDGATKETYEMIRKGSRFENVVKNVKDIAALKEGRRGAVYMLFVVMDVNIHELPAMIRLAKELGIPELFAQAVEIRSTPFLEEGDNIDLKTPAAQIKAYLDETYAEAERLGIVFSPTNGLVSLGNAVSEDESSRKFGASGIDDKADTVSESFVEGIKLCNVPWFISPRIGHDGKGMRPTTACCHMPNTELSGNLWKIDDFRNKSINYIYNSDHYWNIRQGLLDGSIAKDACRGCQYYMTTQWTPAQIRILEKSVADATARVGYSEPYAKAFSSN